MKHKAWWLAVAAFAACGDDDGPLVCPAGTEPRDGICVTIDGGRPDGGDSGLDAGEAPVDAPMGCVPTGDDSPDPEFVDSDCDGFDGDLATAVAVLPEGVFQPPGVAATAPTIGEAIDVASTMGLTQVWVPAGDYEESIDLVEGISIFGGYEQTTWARSASAVTRIVGAAPLLRGASIDVATEVAAIRFEASDVTAPGASSIVGVLEDVATLHLRDVALVAGRGADGVSGEQPMQSLFGRRGTDGGVTGIGPMCSAVEVGRALGGAGGLARCECGDGGAGGRSSEISESNRTGRSGEGYAAAGGSCDFGSPSANNGSPAAVGAAGGDGRLGAPGRPGADGAGAASFGAFSASGYVPSDGALGTNGREGQGGGGGGAARDARGSDGSFCVYFGASGAGGGSGGCGGTSGDAGTGGGASVALLLVDTSVRLTRVELRARSGGAGGDGARGGLGGEGGPGGMGQRGMGTSYRFELPSDPIQPGGDGGAGGAGGQGGGGGGGGGGPSFGLVLLGDSAESPDSSSVFIDIGSGGPGGRGGGTANAGANGDAQPRFLLTLEE